MSKKKVESRAHNTPPETHKTVSADGTVTTVTVKTTTVKVGSGASPMVDMNPQSSSNNPKREKRTNSKVILRSSKDDTSVPVKDSSVRREKEKENKDKEREKEKEKDKEREREREKDKDPQRKSDKPRVRVNKEEKGEEKGKKDKNKHKHSNSNSNDVVSSKEGKGSGGKKKSKNKDGKPSTPRDHLQNHRRSVDIDRESPGIDRKKSIKSEATSPTAMDGNGNGKGMQQFLTPGSRLDLPDESSPIPSEFQTRSGSAINKEPWQLDPDDKVEVLKKIGAGGMGEVFKAKWRAIVVAVKTCRNTKEQDTDRFKKEIELMSRIRHPNIVLFLAANLEPENTFFLTEYVDLGDMHKVINTNKPVWKIRVRFAIDIARGMNYLHRNNPVILHRDLKSLNVLIDQHYTAKVADFGISKLTTGDQTAVTNAGTINWSAPELIECEKATKECDVYSYGVVLWEILSGEFPWTGLSAFAVLKALKAGERPPIPKDTDPEFEALIQKCWNQTPSVRPNFEAILTSLESIEEKCDSQDEKKKALSKKIRGNGSTPGNYDDTRTSTTSTNSHKTYTSTSLSKASGPK